MQKLRKKMNIGVGLVMIMMLIPSFFGVSYSHKEINQAVSKPKNVVMADKKVMAEVWETLPQRPVTIKPLQVYKDAQLKQIIGQLPSKTQLSLTAIEGRAFKLANGQYISSEKSGVVSDLPLLREKVQFTVYTHQTINVYYNPVTTYDKEILTVSKGNQQFEADKRAKTYWGSYYEIQLPDGRKGWVDEKEVSLENPKIQQVQRLLDQKYNQKKYSIYVKQLGDKFTAGINENQKLYSASLSKLPILYWTQKQINEGKATLSDKLLYRTAVNTFYGAYQPAGTGTLPKTADNKVYTLQEVINRTAKQSDNVGSNLLSYYEAHQFSPEYQKNINQIAGSPWNPKSREASARMVGKVLEALYNEGGASFNALFDTAFDEVKIKAGLPQNVPVAHKIGGADRDNHDAAIVFAKEPYLLVIETDGASDEEISQISKAVYEVMK